MPLTSHLLYSAQEAPTPNELAVTSDNAQKLLENFITCLGIWLNVTRFGRVRPLYRQFVVKRSGGHHIVGIASPSVQGLL
jgi:hypothetical protein